MRKTDVLFFPLILIVFSAGKSSIVVALFTAFGVRVAATTRGAQLESNEYGPTITFVRSIVRGSASQST
jgi:hypothetical protein